MELISKLRQMMADQKFFEVQSLIEVQFNLNSETQHELLLIYYEALKAQDKKLSPDYLLEIADFESSNGNYEFASILIQDLNPEISSKYFIRIYRIKIGIASSTGKIDNLYELLSSFFLIQYKNKNPFIPDWINSTIEKYFKHDFNLKLKKLAIHLLRNDLKAAESLTKELIISCVEKSNAKGISEKLLSIGEILKTNKTRSYLEIYQNYCFIYANGFKNSSDIKKIIEICIFFDEYKFQVIFLSLLNKLGFEEVVINSAEYIKLNNEYDYVYLDKFFGHLKKYFFTPSESQDEFNKEKTFLDLSLSIKQSKEIILNDLELTPYQDEDRFIHLLKHQTYSYEQLCDLAVCFLQAELPKVAFKISERILDIAESDHGYLKGCYLKLSSLLMMRDYRAAIDVSFQALGKATTENDILSFMYVQGEVYIRLGDYKKAQQTLQKIVSIDPQYRMAKERLDNINEI